MLTYLLNVDFGLFTFLRVIGSIGVRAMAVIGLHHTQFDGGLVLDFSLTLEARGIFFVNEKNVIFHF
jgi:hypothetical protein